MDTELARTFLAVVTHGSFVAASERLCVTQSTVSLRIQRLEEQLGAALFVRDRAGSTLTPAGRSFQKHAAVLTRTVQQARQELGAVGGFDATLTVGCRMGLWENLLLPWLPRYRQAAPSIAVRAVIGFEDDLMPALIEGRIDLGVMYTPQARPGLRIEPLLEERLVMVTTHPPQPSAPPGPAPDYVLVDWGPEFLAQHALAFPQFEGAALSVNMGWLGLERLLAFGGSGYFPLRLVRAHERAGTLHRVSGTPEFSLPAYLCHTASPPTPHLGVAIDGIRNIAVELG